MALIFSDVIKNARLQVICNAIDSGNGKLVIYNLAQDVICELAFPNPCKYAISGSVLTFNNLDESMVLLNSVVTNAKVITDDDTVLFDLSVGDSDSDADIKLPSTTLYKGSLLRLNGWTITES